MLFVTGCFFCSHIIEAWLSLICYEYFYCFSVQCGPRDECFTAILDSYIHTSDP